MNTWKDKLISKMKSRPYGCRIKNLPPRLICAFRAFTFGELTAHESKHAGSIASNKRTKARYFEIDGSKLIEDIVVRDNHILTDANLLQTNQLEYNNSQKCSTSSSDLEKDGEKEYPRELAREYQSKQRNISDECKQTSNQASVPKCTAVLGTNGQVFHIQQEGLSNLVEQRFEETN